jgi:hypothetical protein
VHVADVQADPEFAYANRDVEPIRTILRSRCSRATA